MPEPIAASGADSSATGWPPELDEEYEFLGELGRGGMAVVYRARERSLGREVAVKVVRPRYHSDAESVARLAREARTVAQLEHPNIVSLHAVKRLNTGLALVMQIVPGRTLKSALASGPLPVERAEHVLRDITRALAYAHSCGVVHRDVKPENIFLDDITGRALLSDFGVARSITESSELTATGTAIGTPTYMSPEQIDGGALDGRSDLYALGMVAWEMLSGQRPWMGESLYSVIYRQKHDSLPPLDLIRSDVPPRLQYLIEGLMNKRAGDRWPGASRFLAILTGNDHLPGFREWQSIARKRRRTGSWRAVSPTKVRSVSPASSTVHFRRGDTPAGVIPSSTNEQSITPRSSGGVGVRVSPSSGEVVPGLVIPTTGPALRRRPTLVLTLSGVGLATVVGLLAMLTRRDSPPPAPAAEVQRPAVVPDGPGRELPVLATAPDSVAAAGTVDSSLLSGLPRADSTPAVGTRPTLPVPLAPAGNAISRPAVIGSPAGASDSGTSRDPAGTAPALPFPAERSTVAAGLLHSCAIDAEGAASCWGSNESGQLGDGTLVSSTVSVRVSGAFEFASVTSGQSHTCGVTRDGEALCWGNNVAGQLGDGTTAPRSAPVRVSGGRTYRSVGAGSSHTCGLTTGGSVACWGSNSRGQLGTGTAGGTAAPVPIALGSAAAVVTAGSSHSCALTRSGEAFCWGRNDNGQLGDGTAVDRAAPVRVAGDARYTAIAAGYAHSCAVTAEGQAWCWGRNQYGQLGTGSATDASAPQRVEAGVDFSNVTVGLAHSCARTRDARAWCWGRNVYGQLGDGTIEDRSRPVAVRGGTTFTVLSASGSHTCGFSAGETYCWGYNINGQLGSGDREQASAPARIAVPPR